MVIHDTQMFFFFNDTATTEIYTLSLHDALPISHTAPAQMVQRAQIISRARHGESASAIASRLGLDVETVRRRIHRFKDRKSTRLNSSHANISYAVFCLKKKKKIAVESCNHLSSL